MSPAFAGGRNCRKGAAPSTRAARSCLATTASQLVIDIAGELSARQAHRFEDYTEAIRNLSRDPRFPSDLVHELVRLPVSETS
jgi:hypothetical protein